MQQFFDVVQTPLGRAVPNATVTVYTSANALAVLYSDNGVTTKANPITTNSDGEYGFYAVNGTYHLTITAAGFAGDTRQGIVLFDPADPIAAEDVAYTPAGTGAVVTTVQAKLRESVSVKDFGAKGDGVTDDTAAIQAAIDSIPASGGTVFFPDGVYQISATLTITRNQISLKGSSRDAVKIVRTTAFGTSIVFSSGSSTYLDGGGIYDIRLIDNGTNGDSGVQVQVVNMIRFQMQNVTIYGGYSGLILEGVVCVIVDCVQMFMQNAGTNAYTGRYGIALTNSTAGYPIQFCSNVTISNTSIYAGDQGVTAAYSNLQYGILATACDGLWVDNSYIGGAGDADFCLNRTNSAYTLGNIYVSNTMLDICRGDGFSNISTQRVSRVIFEGSVSCTNVGQPGKNGVVLGNMEWADIYAHVSGWANSGIVINGASENITVSGCTSTANGNYGIQIEYGATDFIVAGCNLVGNTVGGMDDSSGAGLAHYYLEGNLGYTAPWIGYTPTVTPASGSITCVASGIYKKVGSIVYFNVSISSISADTGASYLAISLPSTITPVSAQTFVGTGVEDTTNFLCVAKVSTSANAFYGLKYDGTYPSAVGRGFTFTGSYQAQ